MYRSEEIKGMGTDIGSLFHKSHLQHAWDLEYPCWLTPSTTVAGEVYWPSHGEGK